MQYYVAAVLLLFVAYFTPIGGILLFIFLITSIAVIYNHFTSKPTKELSPIHSKDRDLVFFLATKKAYLTSTVWKNKRNQRLFYDNYACSNCSAASNLEVHHISYSRVPNEPLSDLVTLCRSCHQRVHDRLGYPKSYEDYMTKRYKTSIYDTLDI